MVASEAGQEVVYLRVLLKGFGYPYKKPTDIWDDNTSCITSIPVMSENISNRDRDMSM